MNHHIAKDEDIQSNHNTFVHKISKWLPKYNKECSCHHRYACPYRI